MQFHYNRTHKILKYNRSSIKGDENEQDNFLTCYILYKYNRSSIKGDENMLRSIPIVDLNSNTTAPR